MAGLKPDEYWQCSLEDALLWLQASEIAEDRKWLHTREIAYMVYCSATEANGRETIFEFMPLQGDPTKEEIAAAKKAKYRKKVERQRQLMNNLAEKGLIKIPVKSSSK